MTELPPAGAATVNSVYGTRIAVLAGDFLFAQSSWFLANLDNLEVIKLISQVRLFSPPRVLAGACWCRVAGWTLARVAIGPSGHP